MQIPGLHKSAQLFKRGFQSMVDLFYPQYCICCQEKCLQSNELFCEKCQYHVHPSDMFQYETNPFTDHFQGRIPLVAGSALFIYTKGGRVQQMLEALKYKNKPEIGIKIGERFGQILLNSKFVQGINCIIPVPLHKKRQILRGYNQSEKFAKGLSEILNIPVRTDILSREIATHSQVEKHRAERFENMQRVFRLLPASLKYEGSHFLLVDDVLTTGATLESCARELLQIKGSKISMLTIAMGK